MDVTSNPRKAGALLRRLWVLILGLSMVDTSTFAEKPPLQELREEWTRRLEAASEPIGSKMRYELTFSVMSELLSQADSKQLESYIHDEAATPKPPMQPKPNPAATLGFPPFPREFDDFHECLRAELLRKCAERPEHNSLILLLLTTAPPQSNRYTEYFLAQKMGTDGIALILRATRQAQDELAKERLLSMLHCAFLGLYRKHPDEIQFLEACSQWLIENKSRVKREDNYIPSLITRGNRSERPAPESIPDCILFVPLSPSEKPAP